MMLSCGNCFTPYVGVAPGTTTMQTNGVNGLGVCPPGHYGPAIMLPGAVPAQAGAQATVTKQITWNPYATESKLKGLRGASGIRWDLFVLMFGLAFGGVIGYRWLKKR